MLPRADDTECKLCKILITNFQRKLVNGLISVKNASVNFLVGSFFDKEYFKNKVNRLVLKVLFLLFISLLHGLVSFESLITRGDFLRSLITFANYLDPDEAPQNVGPDLRSKLF